MRLTFAKAKVYDAAALAALHASVAEKLTERLGKGHWSYKTTERGVLNAIRASTVIVGRTRGEIVATFHLATKKPWAIDVSYFTPAERPLYLTNMAVRPDLQRLGLGRQCLDEAERIARRLKSGAIRLDAYDVPGGAGRFYGRCGYAGRGKAKYRGSALVYYELVLRE